jgi:hypothetical protein
MFCLPCSSAALQHNASSERVQAIFVAVQQSEGFAPQKAGIPPLLAGPEALSAACC